MDLYVNYDCDLNSANILERVIEDVSKIAQGRGAIELGAVPGTEGDMRLKGARPFSFPFPLLTTGWDRESWLGAGLRSLVSLLRCMVLWSRELYQDPAAAPSQVTTPTHEPRGGSEAPPDAALVAPNGPAASASSAYLYELQKQQKDVIEMGIDMFNKKWKKGLAFLQVPALPPPSDILPWTWMGLDEQGQKLVGETAVEIATFFHSEDRLDKSVVGDFLGENEPFCKEVRQASLERVPAGLLDRP